MEVGKIVRHKSDVALLEMFKEANMYAAVKHDILLEKLSALLLDMKGLEGNTDVWDYKTRKWLIANLEESNKGHSDLEEALDILYLVDR